MRRNELHSRILLIGSHHGHELLGDYLWSHIRANRPELLQNLDFTIANPRAKSSRVRLIESDMNRSYNGKSSTYEERLASALLKRVQSGKYGFVLDLHTTTTDSEPTIIIANFKYTWKFIKSSNIGKIVKMPKNIARTSFIGNFLNSVSIEISEKNARDPGVLNSICDDIDRFIRSVCLDQPRNFYAVKSYLKQPVDHSDNTEKVHSFLAGEKSYDASQYIGFAAIKINPPYKR